MTEDGNYPKRIPGKFLQKGNMRSSEQQNDSLTKGPLYEATVGKTLLLGRGETIVRILFLQFSR